jgi:hypothetical protein
MQGYGVLWTLSLLIPIEALVIGLWSLTDTSNVTPDDIHKTISNSEPDDWSYDDGEGLYTYQKDVKLRLEDEEYMDRTDFEEDWVTVYQNPTAYRRLVYIYYGTSLIEKEYIIQVDEHRMFIPLPDSESHSITEHQYHFGKIINLCKYESSPRSDEEIKREYDQYLELAEISVESQNPVTLRERIAKLF